MIQRLSDLFEQAGLYGCNLNKTPAPNYSTCNTAADQATTDTTDNYDRIEMTLGIDQIGSGEGQKQLCGSDSSPFPVDFSRSSKPIDPTLSCHSVEVAEGFGKDAVPGIDFPRLEGNGSPTGSYFNNQVVGPVADGWLPGDSITCDQTATCSGTPFTDESNVGGTSSVMWRLYCSTDTTPGAPDQRITDWGQLTNLSGGHAVGNGTPINVPITIDGVNPNSGTEYTFAHFADSGQTTISGGVTVDLCGNTNTNQTPLMNNTQALENDASQLTDFATAPGIFGSDSGATLTADQDAFVETSLYYMSNGAYQSDPYDKAVTVNGLSTVGLKMTQNGVVANSCTNSANPACTLMNNDYYTARTIYNIYRTDTLRASTADFINWVCDSNSVFQKGKDLSTGKNYDAEITTAIQNTYGFIRLTDTTAAPNNSCQLINVPPSVTDGVENGTTTISSVQGFAQAGQTPAQVGDLVTGSGIPANTYVASITDGNDIVLTNATGTGTGITITFNIHDPNT